MHKPGADTFDQFEVSMVHEFSDHEGGTFCEPVNSDGDINDEEAIATFFTVYGHREGQGAEALCDRHTIEEALSVLVGIGAVSTMDAVRVSHQVRIKLQSIA